MTHILRLLGVASHLAVGQFIPLFSTHMLPFSLPTVIQGRDRLLAELCKSKNVLIINEYVLYLLLVAGVK